MTMISALQRADPFIRENWRAGIGEPDVSSPDIRDVITDVWRVQSEGAEQRPWERCATLEVDDPLDNPTICTTVLWISGSQSGALIFGRAGVVGIDAGTSLDLKRWATIGIVDLKTVPYELTGPDFLRLVAEQIRNRLRYQTEHSLTLPSPTPTPPQEGA